MDHSIRPLDPAAADLAGRAFTVAARASRELPENPYEHELAAVDSTPRGAVVVIAAEACLDVAVWGELLRPACAPVGASGP